AKRQLCHNTPGSRRFAHVKVGVIGNQVCFADSIVCELKNGRNRRVVRDRFTGWFGAECRSAAEEGETTPAHDRRMRELSPRVEHSGMLATTNVARVMKLGFWLTKVTLRAVQQEPCQSDTASRSPKFAMDHRLTRSWPPIKSGA